mgnify:CR=1 FL=1
MMVTGSLTSIRLGSLSGVVGEVTCDGHASSNEFFEEKGFEESLVS